MGFAGAFVFIEPSPYEIVGVIAMILFGITGLTLRSALAPLVFLLLFLNVGFAISVVQVIDQPKSVIWVAVSAFLATTAIFYAGMLGNNTEVRLKWLLRGYLAAAVVASLIGVAAYFRLFGARSELFLLYDRVRGTFNDPNVLGAFLVLPALLAFERVLAGRLATVIGKGLVLLVLLAALLLSFSRAAWGQFAFCALLVMVMTFVTSRSHRERLRLVVIAIVGVLALTVVVSALLSIGGVADLLKQRASLDQSYVVGHYGRFGRYLLGAELALDRPFGLGPLQFAKLFFEDPHNTTYHAVYAAYLGVAAESFIVDIDHWRHFFLILGVLWGLMAASRAWLQAQPHSLPPARAA